MSTILDMLRPLRLAANLLARFWPQLLLIGATGYIVRDLLMEAALAVGVRNPVGGMIVLSSVVLAKLLVVVAMFATLQPGLPALTALRRQAGGGATLPDKDKRSGDQMLAVTAAVILPFFAYYAAWGFLGDTVREYSRLALERMQLGEKLQIFELLQSRGLVASIVACWAVRWFSKRMSKRSEKPWWRLLTVAADASWVFITLYAINEWKNALIAWVGAGSVLEPTGQQGASLSIAAYAADGFTPVEFMQPAWSEQLQSLFFYALLPLVWLVMAAIINGYDLSAKYAPAAPAPSAASNWRKWLQDFAAHFIGGYRSRYRPVWRCLRLTLGAGLATLLTFVVAYRAINWLGAWLWYGATRTIGPYDLDTWNVIAGIMEVFIGSPSDLDGGILLDAVRIALLAAVLEAAVSTDTRRQPERQQAAI